MATSKDNFKPNYFLRINRHTIKCDIMDLDDHTIVIGVELNGDTLRSGRAIAEDFERAGLGNILTEQCTQIIEREIQNRIIKEILFD